MSKAKIKKETFEADGIPRFRQVQVQGLNESVHLISNYENEDMDYLSSRAMRMYRKLRTPKE